MKQIRIVCVPLLLLGVTGCSLLSQDRQPTEGLSKLRSHTQVSRTQDEQQKLNSIVLHARNELKKQREKKYPLSASATDQKLYTEVLKHYQMRDVDGTEFYAEKLNEKFPKSVYSGNAVYLTGQLYLALGLPNEALRYFEMVLQKHPLSHKRAAAIFGKGVAYRKLKLYPYARAAFNEIERAYPGSPEAYRVELEMKVLALEDSGTTTK